ncbi:MAG TPA: DUF4388 domain-containing protein [Thermoanaerobaculia bacterium]|nr:DUF4388 domain-containing protein [Thermoanaerobaculia bacterium]
MPIQGDLKAMPVVELLMWISQFQKTGTLEIRTPSSIETMAFDNGALVFSSSSNPERTLGKLLIKYGVVTEENHKRARELRKTKSIAVAKALLELDIVTEAQLVRFMRKKAERELYDLFDLQEGQFTFTERDLPSLDLLPLRVDVSKMLLRVTQDKDEKGEYDFDSTGVRLEIPHDI